MTKTTEGAQFDLHDPALTRFDIVREAGRRDGIEIVHYEPQFPVPGTKAEKRIVQLVSFLFLFAGALSTAFVVIYIWWPWEYEAGNSMMKGFTPMLGLTLGLSLICVALAILIWGKKLMPHEISIQDRHDGPSHPDERKLTGSTLLSVGEEFGLGRRPLLKFSLLGLAPLGAVAVVLPVGMLIKDPHPKGDPDLLFQTGFNPKFNDGKPVRLMREDETLIRPEEISAGGQITVFPAIPHGASNKHADSPTLLIRLRSDDAAALRDNLFEMNRGSMYGDLVAYSKICTHAGCPASLYEQETNRLLCPCHQSQFLITDNATPIFGPATRALPMLPISVDDEGYLIATSDYKLAVGPAFWEKP